jgi:predicted RNase H-like nuclease
VGKGRPLGAAQPRGEPLPEGAAPPARGAVPEEREEGVPASARRRRGGGSRRVKVAGVDGCRGGWVAVCLTGDVKSRDIAWGIDACFLERIAELGQLFAGLDGVGVDIPIGLGEGWREADRAAQVFLGRRRSSVFSMPPRAALQAASYDEAKVVSRNLTGSMPSRQAYNLAAKALEVERWLQRAPCPVWEVHPEVSFTVLLGHPPLARKKTWSGALERRGALASAGIDLEAVPFDAGARAGVDDVLDAGAAAWSAWRALTGRALCFPDPPKGAAIWA